MADVDDGAGGQQMVLKDVKQAKVPRILGGGTKVIVNNRTVGSPKYEGRSGLIGLVALLKDIHAGAKSLNDELDAQPERDQRNAYYKATQVVDEALGGANTGAFRSDLINYVTDGTLPAAKKGMTVDAAKSFNKYVEGVVNSGNSIMQNNNIPIRSNDNVPSKNNSSSSN